MFKRIWAMGDIHGSYLPISNFYNRQKDNINFAKETDYLILLGDVGANFFLDNRDKKFKKALDQFPFTYFCVRGNHEQRPSILKAENPEKWKEEKLFGNTVLVEKKYPYIKYALDKPSFYSIHSYKTLIFPGAYSVDKFWRLKNHWTWFPQEQLTAEEREWGKQLLTIHPKVDLVLSHTCPICYEPTDLFIPSIDQSTVDKSMEYYLGEIEYLLDYKLYLFGHFHKFRIYPKKSKQTIMLFNEEVLNLNEYFETLNPYFCIY